jgi:ABC-type Fe3+-hydroxamate transport system substrate-binding protein
MRAIVCGGRDYHDGPRFLAEMNRLHSELKFTCIIEGGALGVDLYACNWAKMQSVPHEQYKADWATLKKSAGAIRNLEMILKGKPEVVIAFPGGMGTRDMVQKASDYFIKVIRIDW